MELGPTLRVILRHKLRFGLIAVQIAVTLAIVANCVVLIKDARHRMSRPPVFDENNLIKVLLTPADPALSDDAFRDVWHADMMTRLRGIPGVRAVTSTRMYLWEHKFAYASWPLKPAGSGVVAVDVTAICSDEHFLEAAGAEIDEGRWFTRKDVEAEMARNRAFVKAQERARMPDGKMREPIIVDVVVSRPFGEHVFGPGPLVGKMLEDRDGDFLRIIGVLRGFYVPARSGYEEFAAFYAGCEYAQWGTALLVRADPGRAAAVVPMIEERLAYTGETDWSARAWLVSDQRNKHFGPQRMTAALMGLLIFLLLFVASLGIAGLTSFSVTARTRQIGVRRALGATAHDILRYFLTESGIVTTLGLVLGSVLAVLLNMAVLRIYDSAKLGPHVVIGCALLLWFVALGAALPPALRASRISPAIATRNV